MEKREPTLLLGMQIGVAAMENSKGVSQKTKNRTSSFTLGYLSEWNWKHLFEKIHGPPSVHSNILYSCQNMEAT